MQDGGGGGSVAGRFGVFSKGVHFDCSSIAIVRSANP